MKKPSLSAEQVTQVLSSRFGTVTDLRPLTEGEDSQAFRFRHSDDDFVLRINPDRVGFDKDRYVYVTFANPTLPIPEVIDIWPISSGQTCCVSRLVPGKTLQELGPEQLHRLAVSTASMLDAIAAIDQSGASGFGPFDAKGRGRCLTWRDYLVKIWQPNAHESITISRLASLDRIERYVDEMRRLATSCPEEQRLVHGDFGSNNVMALGDRITGVIDWSEAMYGDPLYDIANILFWRSWLPCMEIQALHFEDTIRDDIDVRRRLRCYQLRIGIDEIHVAALESKRRLLKWALHRCDEIIAVDR